MVWVKVHDDLCKGSKRDLSRATRFIYIELCLEARRRLDVRADGSAWIPLPAKGTLVQAIRDIIGGNPMEIRHAVDALTAGPDPMLAVVQVEASSGPAQRSLVVRSWVAWNQVDDSSKRVAKHREEKRALTNDVTRYTPVTSPLVTALEENRIEESREIPPNPPSGGAPGGEPSAGTASGGPLAPPSSPPVRLTPREQAVAAALANDRSLGPIVGDPAALAVKLCARFPGVDLVAEIAGADGAGAWMRKNPEKRKKDGERFLLNWLKGKDPDRAWVVKAYLAGLKRFQQIDRAAQDGDERAAARVVKEANVQAAHRAAQKLGGFEPTWRDVAAHWLEAYLRLDDAKLAEQGYPLAFMLNRINLGDLPTRPRRRTGDASAPAPPESGRPPSAPSNDPPPEQMASADEVRQLGLAGGFGNGIAGSATTILQRPRYS